MWVYCQVIFDPLPVPPSPFFGEEFGFQVPRDFWQLSFYVMVTDCLPLSRDLKLGKVAIDKDTLVKV